MNDLSALLTSHFPLSTSDKLENGTPANFCFTAGSRIATPQGDVAVEELQTGDMVLSADGQPVAVKWLGRQTVIPMLAGPRMEPVRIRARALGGGLPHTDLTVSADHGLILDGLVINASALVNGSSITFVPFAELGPQFTYYHVETEAHDVILANGAAAETFLDVAGRAAFENHDEYLALYGTERIIPEMHRPRISSQRLLPEALRARLGIRDTATEKFRRSA